VGLDLTPQWLENLLDPDNPFVPWLLLMDLTAVLVHLALVYWVYRDALYRYNRGAPWAVFAAVFPIGGWLFYLLYRVSPLVQMDRLEAETFEESEHEWTDYDQYKANRSAQWFKELASLWRKEEGRGYSPWVRMSRLRELRKTLTPEEKEAARAARRERRQAQLKTRALRRAEAREKKRLRKEEARERRTMVGAHGFTYRLSDRRQRKLKRQLEVVEKLRGLPREDHLLEELIYEMDYAGALSAARDQLAMAKEMGDSQAIVTYEAYIQRLQRLLAEDSADDAPES
jgi:hypothetical protein